MSKIPFHKKITPRLVLLLSFLNFSLLSISGYAWAYGTLQGFVRDESGFAVSGALVSSTEGSSDVTGTNGFFRMAHNTGNWAVTASAPGYNDQIITNVNIQESEITTIDFDLAGSPLRITGAYPSLGKMGTGLNVQIQGNNFNGATRISLIPDSGNKARIISSVETIDNALDIVVTDTIAYVATEDGSLHIIDIANPVAPKLMSIFDTTGESYGVAVAGTTAFVADGSNGLQIVDVSNPANPIPHGREDTLDNAEDVAVAGSFAYVAVGASGLQIVNISDPNAPNTIGSLNTPDYAYAVTVVGTKAYVADASRGLQVVDVTDPANPEPLGSFETPDEAYGIAVSGSIAYVSCYSSLQVIDISNPSSPQFMGSVDTLRRGLDVTVIDHTAYVAVDDNGLQIIDVSDAANPTTLSFVDTPGDASGVAIQVETAYVADGWCGLQAIDISTPGQPVRIGQLITPGKALDITVINNTAYVADYHYGLQIIDVSDPAHPVITGSVEETPGVYALALQVAGQTAYLVDEGIVPEGGTVPVGGGLQVIDVSNSQEPKIVGTYVTPGIAQGIAVANNKAYIADGENGLLIIDVSTPDKPKLLGGYDEAGLGPVLDVMVVGNLAFLACSESGIWIIDVSTPANPISKGSFEYDKYAPDDFDSAESLTVVDGLAYVADRFSGLQIIDISVPANPTYVGSIEPPDYGYAANVTVIGDMAYIADGSTGLHAIDISVPASPVIIGTIAASGWVVDMTIKDNAAYMACDSAGLVIVPVPFEVQSPALVSGTQISLTLPAPTISGNYTIRAFTSEQNAELRGAITFTKEINLLSSKAIIVAGGGPDASGDIWTETKAYANYAYASLLYQGYQEKDIYYLTDEAGAQGRDAAATRENLTYALLQWAKGDTETSGLLLYLVDHGGSEEFQIRGGADMQTVTAVELDSWLDTLQKDMDGKVVFIYDACKSGSFISTNSSYGAAINSMPSGLTQPAPIVKEDYVYPATSPATVVPEVTASFAANTQQHDGTNKGFIPAIMLLLKASAGDRDRIIITSSRSDQVAYFLGPTHSFSYHFWSTLSGKTGNKANLSNAFQEASSIMSIYQTAQMDANGNGISNENDDFSFLQEHEGLIYALRRQYSSGLTKPVVGIVSDNQTIAGSSAVLMARSVYDIDGDAIVRVWAEVIRPDYNPHQDDLTVTGLPTIELEDPDGNGVYEGTYTDLDIAGPYIVNFYAKDAHNIYSQPKTSLAIKE